MKILIFALIFLFSGVVTASLSVRTLRPSNKFTYISFMAGTLGLLKAF